MVVVPSKCRLISARSGCGSGSIVTGAGVVVVSSVGWLTWVATSEREASGTLGVGFQFVKKS